jgi:hypothetical protein
VLHTPEGHVQSPPGYSNDNTAPAADMIFWAKLIRSYSYSLSTIYRCITFSERGNLRVWFVSNVAAAFADGQHPDSYAPVYNLTCIYTDPERIWHFVDFPSPNLLRLAYGDGGSGKYFIFIYRDSGNHTAENPDASRDRIIRHRQNFMRFVRLISEA